MQLTFRSLRKFGLDFSRVDKKVTTTGLRNYTIEDKRNIDGYASKNFNTKEQLHTVIMIHEWWGLNESITRTADIFSDQNIRVFVPDLFRDDAANNAEEAGHKMKNLNWEQALEDIENAKRHLSKSDSKSVSIVGFCMGGALSLAALSALSGWKAGGVFYGIPDLDKFKPSNIKAKTLGHFAAEDPQKGFSDRESAQALRTECKKNNYPVQIRIYENCNHAFCNQDGPYFNEMARNEAFDLTRKLIEE